MKMKKDASEDLTIRVRAIGHSEPMQFEVVVRDASGETHHQVIMSQTDFERLGGGRASPEECVHAAFTFLLDREPKESILRRFNVSVIETYFPEFDSEFFRYLNAVPDDQSGRR